jgi:predicted small secreted protein
MRSRQSLHIAIVCAIAVSVAGCDTIRQAAGQDKQSPDEFAVVTKAPLVIPPDYNLRPPTAGAAPTNQLAPTQAAQAALFSADAATVASSLPATMSVGERYLLANAGVQNADPAIRQEIASDAASTRAADDSFTNNLLFGSATPAADPAVNADAEARRIDAQKAGGAAPPASPAPATPTVPPPPEEKKGSWLDDLFNW